MSEANESQATQAPPVGGKLHGVSLSPFVRKVRAVLAIKNIDYELVNVMPGAMGPEFHSMSPLSKVPVWEESDWTLPDSSVIAAYLERAVPSPSIHSGDARDYGKELFWEEYADTRLIDAGGAVFFQRVVRAKIFKEKPDESLISRSLDEMLPMVFDQLEALFIERDGADPSKLTLGNLAIWSPLVNLEHAGVEIDAQRWPGMARFYSELSRHPVLAALLEEERAALASY